MQITVGKSVDMPTGRTLGKSEASHDHSTALDGGLTDQVQRHGYIKIKATTLK